MDSTVSRLTSVLLVLFIAPFPVALSAAHDETLVPRSLKIDADKWPRDNPNAYIPERWRSSSSVELRPPEIEIQLLKGRVDEKQNWAFSVEYKVSSQNYKPENRMESEQRALENKFDENANAAVKEQARAKSEEANVATGRKNPQFDSRTIIEVPVYDCPPGQRKDPTGRCREIIDL